MPPISLIRTALIVAWRGLRARVTVQGQHHVDQQGHHHSQEQQLLQKRLLSHHHHRGPRPLTKLEYDRLKIQAQNKLAGGGGVKRGRSNSLSEPSGKRSLVQHVLRRITSSRATVLRERTTEQLYAGHSAPFLALVGVSLASGSGLITKKDEIDCVCREIRAAASKILNSNSFDEPRAGDNLPTRIGLASYELGTVIAKGCNAVVVHAIDKATGAVRAIKMMFNYDAESNSASILRAMEKEIIPARNIDPEFSPLFDTGEYSKRLPPHPNVVEIENAFADRVPPLTEAMSLFPDALPARLNPNGVGRNMSLFLVMKKYDTSLETYLKSGEQISQRAKLVLLTQLLEGVAHLTACGLAHRDLKSDNVLLEIEDSREFPGLVITDFGCCLPSLSLHFVSPEIPRGGNAALMPPEIINASPGLFSRLDYGKADAWAVGAIAYEIFGKANPFYESLSSRNYSMNDLPRLEEESEVIEALVNGLLEPNPRNRLSASLAATVCQLLLWAPTSWCENSAKVDENEILQWSLTLTTKVICESKFSNNARAHKEYTLVSTFLSRFNIDEVTEALMWIKEIKDEYQTSLKNVNI